MIKDNRIRYNDIDYYCMQCQQFLKEKEIGTHAVCIRNLLMIKKNEEDETWKRILKDQSKRLRFD